jgi:hypothetical protein
MLPELQAGQRPRKPRSTASEVGFMATKFFFGNSVGAATHTRLTMRTPIFFGHGTHRQDGEGAPQHACGVAMAATFEFVEYGHSVVPGCRFCRQLARADSFLSRIAVFQFRGSVARIALGDAKINPARRSQRHRDVICGLHFASG